MSYEDLAKGWSKEPVSYIEIDLPVCSLTHGTLPCTATETGDAKCFNTYASCNDRSNFDSAVKTFRFSSVRIDGLQGVNDPPTIPTLTSLSLSPATLTPAEGLGIRATCSISLTDHPFSMVGIDQYINDRTYKHDESGSFWSRFVTFFPFYASRPIRVFTGFLEEDGTYDPANFRSRTYFIDTIAGPTSSGQVSIKAKDGLKFADAEKAQVPTQSSAILNDDINASTTSLAITDPSDDVKGAYDAGQAYIRVDEETMLVTNITGSNPSYTLTVTRAAMPSIYGGLMTAEEHSGNATVQHCHHFASEQVDDILYYLLNTGAGIDPVYLPTADWQEVVDFGLQSYNFSALITEPTGVKDLLEELSEHTLFMWWDERAAQVRLDSIIRRLDSMGPYNDEEHIIGGSVRVTRDDKHRVSQCWLVFGHLNPVLELDEAKNFASVYVSSDADAEGENEYNQKRVKRIWSRWLSVDTRSVATEITNRYLNFYRDTKNSISFELSAKDYEAWTGDIVNVSTKLIQDFNGTNPERAYRILEANEMSSKGETKYKYVMQSLGSIYNSDAVRHGLITPNTMGDYYSESESNLNRYAFICYDDRGDGRAGFPNSDEPYVVI